MLLSILIPVYNVERYINRCLNSIYSQLPINCEVILVNDGSTDNSGIVCNKYAAIHEKSTTIIHKNNGGVASTRNTVMDNSRGRYIWFVDPDDYIQPNSIERILKAVEDYHYPDVLSFAYKNCDDTSHSELQNAFADIKILSGAEYLNSYRIDPYLWNKIYRREFLIENELRFDERLCICEDSLFNMQVYVACQKIVLTGIYAYNYYHNPNSTLHSPSLVAKHKNAESSIIAIKEFNTFLLSKNNFSAYNALENWQNYNIAGFLHAVMLDYLTIKEIKSYINKLKEMDLYPLKKSDNNKANLFRIFANCKPLFLLTCGLHNYLHYIRLHITK